jgi:hypothetical protein
LMVVEDRAIGVPLHGEDRVRASREEISSGRVPAMSSREERR